MGSMPPFVPRAIATVIAAFALNLCLAQTMPATDLPPELTKWMAAIVQQESGNKPWAILNNTYFREKTKPAGGFFATRELAEEYASKHIAMGHNLDLGKYQLNWNYQKNRPGVTLANIFDPYVQEQIGKAVLKEFYLKAKKIYGPGELAERRAVSAYNNGNVNADNVPYLTGVYRFLGKTVAGLSGEDTGASTSASAVAGEGSGAPADGTTSDDSDKKEEEESVGLGTILGTALGVVIVIFAVVAGAKFLAVFLKVGTKKVLKAAVKQGAKAAYRTGRQAEQDASNRLG